MTTGRPGTRGTASADVPAARGCRGPRRVVMGLLFVCGRNRLRSPTAKRVFAAAPGVEAESAGVAPDADSPVTPELIARADVILAMEPAHRAKLARAFPAGLRGKRVVCLGIPDDYGHMDPELVRLLWDRAPRSIPALSAWRPR